MRDHPVRPEFRDREIGISEVDRDQWNACSAGGLDVGGWIPDHDGPLQFSPVDVAVEGIPIVRVFTDRVLTSGKLPVLGPIIDRGELAAVGLRGGLRYLRRLNRLVS